MDENDKEKLDLLTWDIVWHEVIVRAALMKLHQIPFVRGGCNTLFSASAWSLADVLYDVKQEAREGMITQFVDRVRVLLNRIPSDREALKKIHERRGEYTGVLLDLLGVGDAPSLAPKPEPHRHMHSGRADRSASSSGLRPGRRRRH